MDGKEITEREIETKREKGDLVASPAIIAYVYPSYIHPTYAYTTCAPCMYTTKWRLAEGWDGKYGVAITDVRREEGEEKPERK